MNPIAIELITVVVEELLNLKQEVFSLQEEEDREAADDANLAPRLNELLSRLRMQEPGQSSPELTDM